MWWKKRKKRSQNKHHRNPKSLGGDNSKKNIVIVSKVRHNAYHILFANGTPYDVANELNQTWIHPDYELVVRRRENVSNPSV